MKGKRIACALLGALMLLGAVLPGAFAALPSQREEPAAFALGNSSEAMLLGGGRSVQADEALYYLGEADDFVYRFDGEESTLLCPMAARCLNYINGALYFASENEEDAFAVYRCDPVTAQTEPLLTGFPGELLQLYAAGDGTLWFAADETIWRMAPDGEPEAVRTAEGLLSFAPTPYGPIYACGSLFDYDVYFDGALLVEGAMSYYVLLDEGEPRLVYNRNGEDLQISLSALAAGERAAQSFTGLEKEAETVLSPEEEAALFEQEGALPVVEQMPLQTRALRAETISRPATPGMIKTALRAYQMTDVAWTPVTTVRGWTKADGSTTVYYQAGKTYHGIPYGWPYDVGGYVPWSKSLVRFVNAVADGSSDFYTKRSGVRNGLCYATDCSGFVSWAWNTASRQTCTGLRSKSYCMLVSSSTFAGAEIGDAFISSSHTVIITNIKYNSAGTITAIEIGEANPTSSRSFNASRFWYGAGGSYSLASLEYYFKAGYKLYRNANRESVKYEESPAVTVSHDTPILNTSNKAESHRGIDVSEWNGKIDWAAVAKSGVEFAILRSSRGLHPKDENGNTIFQVNYDDRIRENIRGCIANKIPFGIYHYATAITPEEAMQEAGAVVNLLFELGGFTQEGFEKYKPQLPIFYDVEDAKTNLSLDKAKLYSVISSFCSTIGDVGLHAGVYASTSVWNTKLTGGDYSKWCSWVAQYYRCCEYKNGMNLWQYSEKGSVSGISTNVDMNYWYGELGDESHKYRMSQYVYCTIPGYNAYESTDGKVSWTEPIDPIGHYFVNDRCTRCGLSAAEAASESGFADVYKEDWYYEAVTFAAKTGLFKGTSTYFFSPNDTMTRAMMVTVLHRLAGLPSPTAENPFEDVKQDDYYCDAVRWAYGNGIVKGVSDTRFDPDGEITREQMATMLFRYTATTDAEMNERAELSGFPDAAETSDWAVETMSWAVGAQLINGSLGNDNVIYLAPGANATRAQVAMILMRYQEKYNKQSENDSEADAGTAP